MSWTDERVDRLKALWEEGKSAAEIAEILGDVSRNAVIGKAHRLGLSGRPSPIRQNQRKTKAEPKVEKKPKGATILDLNERMCKWPIGDPKLPGFYFCGRPSIEGLPYCSEHASIAYQFGKRRDDEPDVDEAEAAAVKAEVESEPAPTDGGDGGKPGKDKPKAAQG